MTRGVLVLVVGPSGVGKDTLIDGARAALAGDERFLFARRVITRPADAGGEDHEPASTDAFDRRKSAGGFLLSWRAHGLGYGVPAELSRELEAGRCVVVNVSRTVIDDARRRLQPVRVISISASAESLAARLVDRGRETPTEIAVRTERAGAISVEGGDVERIANDGAIEAGVARFVEALRRMTD
ncbi:phosphonate metabolism protein/1,5-bisphosphokinase (PRPP-forming) PhnN [bacterium]|nr:phosphonate metabolism protein/1,5-bisphosphokinase (PRPP-forming) PhnN [bacterium]